MHAQTNEHILLESDARVVPDRRRARITHAVLHCRSRLRLHHLELAIIDYYYLAVRTRRRSSVRDYVVDLRFVSSSIETRRHIPWNWILATLAVAGVATFCLRQLVSSSSPWWQQHGVPLCSATLGLTACAIVVSVWRTCETLLLRSVHGGATVLDFTGSLGTLRSFRKFTLRLAIHIQFAVADRRASQAEHLRDEMREHFRLKEAGVLSEEQYETSKAQILAQHAPVREVHRP